MLAGPRPSTEVPNAGVDVIFVMFVGNNFFGQTVSFGVCWGVVFSHDNIYCQDPSAFNLVFPSLFCWIMMEKQYFKQETVFVTPILEK